MRTHLSCRRNPYEIQVNTKTPELVGHYVLQGQTSRNPYEIQVNTKPTGRTIHNGPGAVVSRNPYEIQVNTKYFLNESVLDKTTAATS